MQKSENQATIVSYNKTMDDRIWSNLPPEILIEVLLPLLPLKSLCRFKCVSPSWKTLISSPHFVQTYLNRTMANYHPPPYKAILFSSSKNFYSVDFADANPTLNMVNLPPELFNQMSDWSISLSSCNGLVLVSDSCNFNLLLNPCTSEYKELPRPYRRYASGDLFYRPVLGYESSTNDFKVVSLVWREVDFDNYPDRIVGIVHASVYSLKANAWRGIQDFPADHPVVKGRGVCFNERLHWPCNKRNADWNSSKVIVTFGLADEVFGEVGLPALGDHRECRRHNMVVLWGRLCLLVSSMHISDRIDVWMMMEYGVRGSWAKFSTAYPGWSISDVLCLSAQDDLVLGRKNLRGVRRVIDEFEGDKLVLYNPVKVTRRDLVVPGIPPRSLVGDHYIETLVSPNHQFLEAM